MKPCKSIGGGMELGGPCPDCDHVVAAHRWTDRVCSICEAVEEIHAAATPRLPLPAAPEEQCLRPNELDPHRPRCACLWSGVLRCEQNPRWAVSLPVEEPKA